MVETGEVNETADQLKEGFHRLSIAGETGFVRAAGGAENSASLSAGRIGEAALLGVAISTGLSQWDYLHDRDNLRRQYELELAARTNKPLHAVNNKDLDNLGKQNAAVGDALRRAKIRRNISIVAGVIAVGAATVVGGALLAPAASAIAGALSSAGASVTAGAIQGATLGSAFSGGAGLAIGFVAKAIVVGTASVAAFMGVEKVANAAAAPVFGMKEPTIHRVLKNPTLQKDLSLSSQVNYIEHLQKRVHANKPNTFISQEQVFKVFLKANKGVDEAIKSNFGTDFSSLSPEQRVQVLGTLGKQVNLEQITTDLNHKQIRAQELAFLVQGENSGVSRHEAPRVTALEKAHTAMEQQLQQAHAEINRLKLAIKPKSTQLGNVSGQAQSQEAANDAAPAQNQPGKFAQAEQARRQQAPRQTGISA